MLVVPYMGTTPRLERWSAATRGSHLPHARGVQEPCPRILPGQGKAHIGRKRHVCGPRQTFRGHSDASRKEAARRVAKMLPVVAPDRILVPFPHATNVRLGSRRQRVMKNFQNKSIAWEAR